MPVPWERSPLEQNHEQIWVVDDDEGVADSLKSLLKTFGYDVQSYNSGTDFLADDRRRVTGCLIIDQHMPGMDGLDVVDRLQKQGVRRSRLFGQLPGRNKLQAGSRLLV